MFQLYLRTNQHNKLKVERFILKNGKIVENQGHQTDFSWIKAHITERITLVIDEKEIFEATFFYAEFNGEQIIVEIGDMQRKQTIARRKIS